MVGPPRRLPEVSVVASRQQPHEIFLVVLSGVFGVAYLVGAPPPESVAALIDPWLMHFWAAGLAVGGLLGALALGGWGGTRVSLRVEQAAMSSTALALCVAASTIFQVAGDRGFFGVGFCLSWAMANLARVYMIQSDLRKLQRIDGPLKRR